MRQRRCQHHTFDGCEFEDDLWKHSVCCGRKSWIARFRCIQTCSHRSQWRRSRTSQHRYSSRIWNTVWNFFGYCSNLCCASFPAVCVSFQRSICCSVQWMFGTKSHSMRSCWNVVCRGCSGDFSNPTSVYLRLPRCTKLQLESDLG